MTTQVVEAAESTWLSIAQMHSELIRMKDRHAAGLGQKLDAANARIAAMEADWIVILELAKSARAQHAAALAASEARTLAARQEVLDMMRVAADLCGERDRLVDAMRVARNRLWELFIDDPSIMEILNACFDEKG